MSLANEKYPLIHSSFQYTFFPSHSQSIRDFMMTRDAIYLLRETKKLTIRKENMNMNRNKNKPQSPSVLTSRELRKMPMMDTNFGVNTKHNYIFNSSVFALETILSKLNIQV